MSELVQTANNVLLVSGQMDAAWGIAGEAISAGMPVYKDSADGDQYKKSRANAEATALCDGIAMCSAGDGQPIVVARLDGVVINLGATLTIGETYVVSDATAGKIQPIGDYGSGDFPVILGTALTAANFELNIKAAGVAKA